MPRSAHAIVAILAVLKTGAAYLPIDPALPDARIDFILDDATPIAAITTTELRPRLHGRDLTVIDINDPTIDTQPDTALPEPRPRRHRLPDLHLRHHRHPQRRRHHPPQRHLTHGITPRTPAHSSCLVAMALPGIRRLGVRDLGRVARRWTPRRGARIGDPLTPRPARPTHRRTRHRPQPNPVRVL